MIAINNARRIGVVGAGAMGAGIAQVAARRGHHVLLADASADALTRAHDAHRNALQREVDKGRLTTDASEETLARFRYVPVDELSQFRDCTLIIEAIVERLDAKQALFQQLESAVSPDAILATNTSSLSIAAIAGACAHPERVIGMHFFNPAPVMPLVEVIPALTTRPLVTDEVRTLAESWGKVTVVAADSPGFIVNRIARPFYGESLRIMEEGRASCATIDWALREIGGFRMGPFELMDFIGNDVNYAVTMSVYEATYHDSRYRPSITQRRLVEAGWLGRKSGRGYYDYRDDATKPEPLQDKVRGKAILDRVLAMLINEAVDARMLGLASVSDIEVAMTRGVNYPRGLLQWGDEIGPDVVLSQLDALHEYFRDPRYRASPLLRDIVHGGGSLRS